MSKIYVSYTARDQQFAQELISGLRVAGHEITIDGTKLNLGTNWRSELNEGLKAANVFIILISQNTMTSQYPMMELGIARAYAESSDKMLILPIIIGDLPLPPFVQDIQALIARDRTAAELIPEIDRVVSIFEGRLVAREMEQTEIIRAVQVNLAEFVDDAISTQEGYEKRHRLSAERWYMIGYGSLIAGLVSTAFLAYTIITTNGATAFDYARSLTISLLNVIAIAILAALARYAYSLGKSYMSESLKSSDRIHAIQFGKFFLRAYGSKSSSTEIREVFQHWNIDRTSTFSSLDTSQIDPQIVNMVVQIVSAVTGKKEK